MTTMNSATKSATKSASADFSFGADDLKILLQRFPPLELSYDVILHKKVEQQLLTTSTKEGGLSGTSSSDLFLLLPTGTKAFVWYTYWHDKNICLVLPLNERNNINLAQAQILPACFTNDLAWGTVLYGTYFFPKGPHCGRPAKGSAFFACTNLYQFCGKTVGHLPYSAKLALLTTLFERHVKQRAYSKHFLVVGLPVIKTSYAAALAAVDAGEPGYKVYGVQIYKPAQVHSLGVVVVMSTINKAPTSAPTAMAAPTAVNAAAKQQTPTPVTGPSSANSAANVLGLKIHPLSTTAVFDVQAGDDADIYYLYKPLDYDTPVGTAIIPSYKASVMMNQLFRHIKENANLDALEESDDEADFENVAADKFVDKVKRLRMTCVYLRQFRKWQPIALLQMKK